MTDEEYVKSILPQAYVEMLCGLWYVYADRYDKFQDDELPFPPLSAEAYSQNGAWSKAARRLGRRRKS